MYTVTLCKYICTQLLYVNIYVYSYFTCTCRSKLVFENDWKSALWLLDIENLAEI